MRIASHGWSEERTTVAVKLWKEGLSASQIAKQLGGVTRNAVIGKVHRLGLAGRATPSKPVKIPARTRPARRRMPQVVVATALAGERGEIAAMNPIAPGLGVLGLTEFTCRYPIGDPQEPDFAFCGRTCSFEDTYCTDHAKLCYVPPKKRLNDGTLRLANWIDSRTFKLVAA